MKCGGMLSHVLWGGAAQEGEGGDMRNGEGGDMIHGGQRHVRLRLIEWCCI
jgi:hypothetical protein